MRMHASERTCFLALTQDFLQKSVDKAFHFLSTYSITLIHSWVCFSLVLFVSLSDCVVPLVLESAASLLLSKVNIITEQNIYSFSSWKLMMLRNMFEKKITRKNPGASDSHFSSTKSVFPVAKLSLATHPSDLADVRMESPRGVINGLDCDPDPSWEHLSLATSVSKAQSMTLLFCKNCSTKYYRSYEIQSSVEFCSNDCKACFSFLTGRML